MPERSKMVKLVQRFLQTTAGSLEELAQEVRVTYGSLYAWAVGRRNPSPRNVLRMAEVAERRSNELRELASAFREAAREAGSSNGITEAGLLPEREEPGAQEQRAEQPFGDGGGTGARDYGGGRPAANERGWGWGA